jgi:hypothetical protein
LAEPVRAIDTFEPVVRRVFDKPWAPPAKAK